MSLTKDLQNLKVNDVYTLMLFVLYKLQNEPDYQTLSELVYLTDKETLLTLCEYYGGMTIKIPTIEELNNVLNALTLYLKVDIEHLDMDDSLCKFNLSKQEKNNLISTYIALKDVLTNYEFRT